MSFFTNKEQIHPSIWIRETKDYTERLEIREAGQVACMAWVAFGNPLLPITINGSFERLKSTIPSRGGDSRNRSLHYLNDFWRESAECATNISRILGIESTVGIIKLVGGAIDTETSVKIFQDGTMNQWEDIEPTEPLEILLKFCPTEPVVLKLESIEGRIYLEIVSEIGQTIYKVNGYADSESVNEDGYSNYIGSVANCNYCSIKSDISHPDYLTDYSITETLQPLAVNIGAEDERVFHSKTLRTVMQQSDLFISAGIENPSLLQMANKICLEFSTPKIIDIVTDDIGTAITKKTNLAITDENTYWIWSRTKYSFLTGNQNIGLSGDLSGKIVRNSIRYKLRRAENRVDGVAFARFPISRNLNCGLEPLSRLDKDKLTKAKINTIEMYGDKLIYGDVLSGSVGNSNLASFPTSYGLNYIKKEIGYIMEAQLGKNLTIGKTNVSLLANLFLDDCRANKFFDNDVNTPYTISVTDENNEVIVVSFGCFMEGVMRRGELRVSLFGRTPTP